MASKVLRSPSLLATDSSPRGRVSLLRPWLRKPLARGPLLFAVVICLARFEQFGVTNLVDTLLLTCLLTLHRDFGLRFILTSIVSTVEPSRAHYASAFLSFWNGIKFIHIDALSDTKKYKRTQSLQNLLAYFDIQITLKISL